MTRFVVDAGVLLHLAEHAITPSPAHELLAPTRVRSEVLSRLDEAVHRGDLLDDVAHSGRRTTSSPGIAPSASVGTFAP